MQRLYNQNTASPPYQKVGFCFIIMLLLLVGYLLFELTSLNETLTDMRDEMSTLRKDLNSFTAAKTNKATDETYRESIPDTTSLSVASSPLKRPELSKKSSVRYDTNRVSVDGDEYIYIYGTEGKRDEPQPSKSKSKSKTSEISEPKRASKIKVTESEKSERNPFKELNKVYGLDKD